MYQISSKRRVKTLSRLTNEKYPRRLAKRILSQTKDAAGYQKVVLYKDAVGTTMTVNRLMEDHFPDK